AAPAASAASPPRWHVIGIIEGRSWQKQWLERNGFPVGAYRRVNGDADIAAAVQDFGDAFVKSCRGGYDGRSQMRASRAADAAAVWRALGERPAVAEQALQLAGELSVMVARAPSGTMKVFPAALNHHERQILAWSV